MGNEVANQAGTKGGLSFQLPPGLAAKLKAANAGNIVPKDTTNQLTFVKGEWSISVNGEKKVHERKVPILDDEGNPALDRDGNTRFDKENIQIVRAVILDWAQRRGRIYYEGDYASRTTNSRPNCFSDDSRRPSPAVAEPISSSCETCPKSFKGSKVSNGKEMVACEQYQLLAITLSPNTPALRLRLKQTSYFDTRDEESANDGWYAWEQYVKHLVANGLDFTGAVITKIRFAPKVDYAKLQFSLDSFLSDDVALKMVERSRSDEVKKLISGYDPGPPPAPKGKPLPQEDEPEAGPTPDQVAIQAAIDKADLEAKATELARASAEARAKAEKAAKAKAAREAKAAAEAEAARLAAEAAAKAKAAEADDADWDEPAAAQAKPLEGEIIAPAKASSDAPPARVNKPKVEAVSPAASSILEASPELGTIVGEWADWK